MTHSEWNQLVKPSAVVVLRLFTVIFFIKFTSQSQESLDVSMVSNAALQSM